MKNEVKYNFPKYEYEKIIKRGDCQVVSAYNKKGLRMRRYSIGDCYISNIYNKKGMILDQSEGFSDGSFIRTKFVYIKDKLCKICREFTVATEIDKNKSSLIETGDYLGRFKYDSTEFVTENIKLRKTEYSTGVFRKRLYKNDEIIIDFIDNPVLENGGFKFYLPKEELEKILGKKFISSLIYHTPFTWSDDFMWSSEYWAHETTTDYWDLWLHGNRGEE